MGLMIKPDQSHVILFLLPEETQVISDGKSCSHSWLTQPLRGQSHLLKSVEVKMERVARQGSVIVMLFSNYFLGVDNTYCLGQKFQCWSLCYKSNYLLWWLISIVNLVRDRILLMSTCIQVHIWLVRISWVFFYMYTYDQETGRWSCLWLSWLH